MVKGIDCCYDMLLVRVSVRCRLVVPRSRYAYVLECCMNRNVCIPCLLVSASSPSPTPYLPAQVGNAYHSGSRMPLHMNIPAIDTIPNSFQFLLSMQVSVCSPSRRKYHEPTITVRDVTARQNLSSFSPRAQLP